MNEKRKLEQEFAYSAARSDIECYCMSEHHSGRHYGLWYDTALVDSVDAEWVAKAVRYLELRKLLKRHPVRNTLIRFVDAT